MSACNRGQGPLIAYLLQEHAGNISLNEQDKVNVEFEYSTSVDVTLV
jgi:hypothetical protein